MNILSRIPFLEWRKSYNKSFLKPDIIAGITIGAFTIPEAIAYASLAGLPPQSGLYAALAALIAYFLFGTSKQLSVGPTSALAILVGSTLGTLTIANPSNIITIGAFVALLTGIFGIVAWILRMGFIVKFISRTVLTGFSMGAAFFIAASQLSKLFGISGSSGGFFDRIFFLITHINEIHLISLLIGVLAIVILILFDKYLSRIPGSLIVVIGSTFLFSFAFFQNLGVDLVGFIPSGLPLLEVPTVPDSDLIPLIGLSAACFILSYVEGMGAAQTFAWKHSYSMDGNKELLSIGAANISAGLIQGFPVGGSMSRSAVNDTAGSKSSLSSGFSSLVLLMVIVFFADFFSNLPEPILAAIVIVAVAKLVDIPSLKKYFAVSKSEFIYAMVTFAGILIFGMLEGLLIGVIVSFIDILYKLYKPRIVELGLVKGTNLYRDREVHLENERIDHVLIFRIDSSQLFINADNIRNYLLEKAQESEDISLLVIDMGNTNRLDITGAEMLETLHDKLANMGIELKLAESIQPVRSILRELGIDEKLGVSEDRYVTVDQVINEWKNRDK